jgi:hypothetical protein
MSKSSKNSISLFRNRLPLPEILALTGFILYLIQSLIYIHTRLPNLDEGSYLFKGLLFAKGVYTPFQPYGFWVNKMYLSFTIWGWLEAITKPGLLIPRYFSFVLGLLTVTGTWIVARRISNRWLAAGIVWVLALNPTMIIGYSLANSEILVIFELILIFVLCLGEKRTAWQVITGSALAGIMVLTRENMVFVLPLLIGYIFWQNGRRIGLISLGALIFVLVVGHAIYWPNIWELWSRWFPPNIFKFFQYTTGNGGINSAANSSFLERLHSLAVAMRIYFIPFVGSIIALLLCPRRKLWPNPARFKTAVFLASTFFILLITHLAASLGLDYCVYCSTSYFGFWGITGTLFLVITFSIMNRNPSWIPKMAMILVLIGTSTLIWYSYFERIGVALVNLPFPRMRNGTLQPGWTTLWPILRDRFQMDYLVARKLVTIIIGLIVGIIFIILVWACSRKLAQRHKLNLGYISAIASLGLGLILTPLFAWPDSEVMCKGDVLDFYETAGGKLAKIIPIGSKVYLDGLITSIPLLYMHDVIVLPPQINQQYSYKSNSTEISDTLLKEGFWNSEIANDWREKSSVFIIGDNEMHSWHDYLEKNAFKEVSVSFATPFCPLGSSFHIFIKK